MLYFLYLIFESDCSLISENKSMYKVAHFCFTRSCYLKQKRLKILILRRFMLRFRNVVKYNFFFYYSVNSITCAETVTSFLPKKGKLDPLISTVSLITAFAPPSRFAF